MDPAHRPTHPVANWRWMARSNRIAVDAVLSCRNVDDKSTRARTCVDVNEKRCGWHVKDEFWVAHDD
jgi:hypothetical protein